MDTFVFGFVYVTTWRVLYESFILLYFYAHSFLNKDRYDFVSKECDFFRPWCTFASFLHAVN